MKTVVVPWKSHYLENKFGATTVLIAYVDCSPRLTQHPNTGVYSSKLGLQLAEEYAQNSDRKIIEKGDEDRSFYEIPHCV